ncbi:hypothetical protein IV203_015072 [Nitzschia inconspicua]|uniref:Uncharacterized protein n=1 Tax=Nitzschia inconspicua TaxID=303405 RepID=A0A9K3PT62_9STRA|nr:hypothetical protein IV203_015072 [Nitzschia inconspicua]
MSEGRPDRPLRIALRMEPYGRRIRPSSLGTYYVRSSLSSHHARVLNFLTRHGETESPVSLARVGTSSDFGHFLTPALRNRRCRHIISTSIYQSFLTRHPVIHQPFFGDGDSRDSDGEDFEEEAALLNESGGVSQPKDGTSRLCVQGLGQSSSIVGVKNASIKVFVAWRKYRGKPADVTWMEIDGDNLMGYSNEACVWASKACVPYGGVSCFDENLQPTNPSSRRCLTYKTLGIYLGQHLQAINDRFPHHDDFKKPADAPKEQVTPWWCAVRNSFLKRCKKFQAAYGDDVAFGIEPVVPLYKNNNLAIGLVILGDPFAAVDQKSVFLEKVQKATNRKGKSLEERCWLVFVGEALARGGEVRYLHYDNWTFHQFTHVLDTQWTEMKTVNTYAMPFVPDKTHWTSDIYHALGSWFLVEDGLHRNMEEIEGGMQNVVFPSLCKTGESSTAKLLTQAIQKCLPDNIKSQITSRSLRDAGITELAAHGSLSIYESCARSGHSTGTTQDHYISDQHYLYGLKAGMARAGYDVSSGDYTKKIHLPRVQAIGSGVDNQLHAFLDKCFTVDVPHFDKGGKLRPVLLTCLATLLQHYKAVLIDCGHDNAIIQHLNKAALHSCLNDPRWPRLAPIEILQKWCGLINSDL